MVQSGRVIFGQMEEVVFGRPAAEVVAEEARRLAANRIFLMVSGTLARETDEIEQDVAHRAARLYRFNEAKYRKLVKQGFLFEL